MTTETKTQFHINQYIKDIAKLNKDYQDKKITLSEFDKCHAENDALLTATLLHANKTYNK